MEQVYKKKMRSLMAKMENIEIISLCLLIGIVSYSSANSTTETVLSSNGITITLSTQSTNDFSNKTTVDTDGDIIITGDSEQDSENGTSHTSTTLLTSVFVTSEAPTTPREVEPPACSYKPCHNNGMCIQDPENNAIFSCSCPNGYTGLRCGTTDQCALGQNGDVCEGGACVYSKVSSSRKCKCFFGTFWDEQKKECRGSNPPCFPNPCLNGGNCSVDEDEIVCACAKGFEGETCELQNECLEGDRCRNGQCVTMGVKKICKCDDQYYYDEKTKTCRIVKPPCQPNPCKNSGKCHVLSSDTYNCSCSDNFIGPTCNIQNYCLPQIGGGICQNGECVNTSDSRICHCDKGFYLDETSSKCRRTFPPCSPNPCKNDGICNPLSSTSFNCTCSDGFTGPQCSDLDLCVLDGGGDYCAEADCKSLHSLGTFVCHCAPGKYFDYSNRTCKDVDFCPVMKCEANEVCGGSECRCDVNYKKDNATGTCKQDFCSSKPCPVTGMECSEDDTQEFKCSCKKGYAFNGTHCNAGAVCIFPSLNTCSQKCEPDGDNYKCACYSDDFELHSDNKTCTYLGNTTCTNTTCQGGTCFVKDGVEICKCAPGFKAIKGKCIDICASGGLQSGFCPSNRCESMKSGGFRCKCDGKYELSTDKTTCTARRMCAKNGAGLKACSANSAICVEDWSSPIGYKCECPPGQVNNNFGACVGICSQIENQRDCSDRGAICRVSSSGRRVCRCPPFFHALGDGKSCNKPAHTSYLLNLPLHTLSYRRDAAVLSRTVDYEKIQPDVNYAKVQMDVQSAIKQLFPEFLQANVLICRENRDYLDCKVELQFYTISQKDLQRLQVAGVCQVKKGYPTTACLVPPSLLLRSQFAQTSVFIKSTDPCDDDLKTELCGSETSCASSLDRKTFNCSCGPGFATRNKKFLFGNTETFVETCKDIDECALENPCADHMKCRNTLGSYECSCLPGYRMKPSSGSRSESCIELCNPNPCVHGTCSKNGDNEFECRCDAGYRGMLCNSQDENYKRARDNTVIVGAVLGGALLLTIILFIVCVSRFRRNKCGDEPANMLYATELTERSSGAINNAYQKE